jgi:hypothetical protein
MDRLKLGLTLAAAAGATLLGLNSAIPQVSGPFTAAQANAGHCRFSGKLRGLPQ